MLRSAFCARGRAVPASAALRVKSGSLTTRCAQAPAPRLVHRRRRSKSVTTAATAAAALAAAVAVAEPRVRATESAPLTPTLSPVAAEALAGGLACGAMDVMFVADVLKVRHAAAARRRAAAAPPRPPPEKVHPFKLQPLFRRAAPRRAARHGAPGGAAGCAPGAAAC